MLAQEKSLGQEREGADERRSGIRFVCTGFTDDGKEEIELLLSQQDGEVQTQKVALHRRKPGRYFPIPRGASIKLGRVDGKQPFTTLASARKPNGARKLLAILIPTHSGGKSKYFMKLIDEGKFRPGDYYFINLTKLKIGVQFEGEKFQLAQLASRQLHPEGLTAPRNSPVAIFFSTTIA